MTIMLACLDELRLILGEILKKKKIGTLSLGRKERQREIFFEAENVYLLNRGNLHKLVVHKDIKAIPDMTDELLGKLAAEARAMNETVPDTLKRRGLIDDATYERLSLVQIREEMLDAIFTCRGSFLFHEGHLPEDLLENESVAARVSLGREDFANVLHARAEQLRGVAAALPSDEEVFVATEKGLAARRTEQSFKFTSTFDLVDGTHTVREIVHSAPFYESTVLLQLLAFLQGGLVKKTVLPELQGIDPAALTAENAAMYLPRFEQAVQYAADGPAARERLAVAYQAMGRAADARAQLQHIGNMFAGAGKADKAMHAYTRALEMDPTSVELRQMISRLCAQEGARLAAAGEHEKAAQSLRQALDTLPGAPHVYVALLELHQKMNAQEAVHALVDEAIEHGRKKDDWLPADALFGRLMEACRHDLALNKRLVNMLLDRGKKDAALQRMEDIASHHLERGETEKAIDVYRKILRLDPHKESAQRALKGLTVKGRTRWRKPLAVRTAVLLVVLLFMGYQTWSFLEYRRVAEAIERNEQDTEAFEEFIKLHPLSISQILARARIRTYKEEHGTAQHLQRQYLSKLWSEAQLAEEVGDQAKARALYTEIAKSGHKPLVAGATEKLEGLGAREREAAEILTQAKARADQGAAEESYASMRTLLSKYGSTDVVMKGKFPDIFYPILVESIPTGAEVRVDGQARGTTPLPLRVHVHGGVKLELRLAGHKALIVENDPREQRVVRCWLSREHEWARTLAVPLRGKLCSVGDVLFAPSGDGTMRAFGTDTGAERQSWKVPGATDIVAGPFVCGDMVAFATNDARLAAITRQRKLLAWPADALITSPVVAAGDSILGYTTSKRKLVGMSLQRGAAAWTRDFPAGAAVRIVCSGRMLVLQSDDGALRAYAAATGAPGWELRAPKDATVTADNELVLIATGRDIQALDAAAGDRLWEKKLGEDTAGTYLTGGELWVSAKNGQLSAFEARTGTARVSTTLDGPVTDWKAAPFGLLVGVSGTTVLCLDRTTLAPQWRYTPSGTITAIEVAGERVFVLVDDRVLACVSR